MTAEKTERLLTLLQAAPQTRAIVEAALAVWPEHDAYMLKSFEIRPPEMLAATEAVSRAARALMAGQEARFAADYRWTCDRLRDEELFFHREGRYRLSTFAEAYAEVYSDHDYMGRYVNGLLLSQVLWYNHIATFEMFLNRVLGAQSRPFDYLEVGPGHGLMTYFAAESPMARSLEAWDVSAVSLRETRAALEKMAAKKPVSLTETDILAATPPARRFDLIVISEVLEHLEQPGVALRFLRNCLAEGGRIFINVPLNSPSPDHIYLLSDPDEARKLAEDAGFRVLALELFATQGRKIESALANRISVSAGIVAEAQT
jgi:SAM-dependent methyltransferase